MLPLIIIAVLFQNVISAVVGDSTCDPPPQIGGTQRLRLNDSRPAIGTVVTYLCEFGYVTQNWDGFRSICQIDPESGNASWTNPFVVCKPQSCGYPGSVPHADRSGSLFTFPNKVEFHCQQGYKMKGLFVRYCQTDGQWSGTLPTCEKKCSADPPRILNGRPENFSGDQLTVNYICDAGYQMRGHFTVYCKGGKWEEQLPICVEEKCSADPPRILNGRPENFSGDQLTVNYICDAGYQMRGHFTVYCKGGKWEEQLPVCVEEKCSAEPPRILNGRPANFSGDELRVNYICDAGYQIRGHSTVYCKGGKWEEQLPSCVEEKCSADPPRILNGRPANFSGDELRVNYICDAGYQMKGHSTVYCKGGKWKGKLPRCVAGAAVPFPNIEERISVSANSSNNSPKPAKPIIVQPEDCTCSYRLHNSSIVAKVNGTILQYGDTIKKGETIVLHCKDEKEHLVWPNKMRTEGYASLSCDECQVWKGKNLPTCNITRQGDFFIVLNRTMKIQPNGVLEFDRKENVQIQCITYDMADPVWYFHKKKRNFMFTCTSVFDGGKRGILLNIPEFKWKYTGTYECTSRRARRYQYRSSKLELQMKTSALLVSTAKPEGYVWKENPPASEENCFCTYIDYGKLYASMDGKQIWWKTVKKSKSIQLKCSEPANQLYLPNGTLIISGSLTWTCVMCGTWKSSDLPTCQAVVHRPGSGSLSEYTTAAAVIPTASPVESTSRKQNATLIEQFDNGTTSDLSVPGNQTSGDEDCFCIYNNGTKKPFAFVNGTQLRFGDKVKRGDTIKLRCRDPAMHLVLSNGTRVLETAALTCDVCQTWGPTYLPSCKAAHRVKIPCNHATVTAPVPTANPEGSIENKTSVDRSENVTASIPTVESSTSGKENCYCTYISYDETLVAFVGEDRLNPSDKVAKNAVIQFVCHDQAMQLVMWNGIRITGKVEWTCDACQEWEGSKFMSCKAVHTATGCLTGDFMESAPENLVLNLLGITAEYQPVGSKLLLLCEDDMVIYGTTTKATCGPLGKWEFGDALCVFGCHLNVNNASSQLIIKPAQQNFRIGDQAVLSCPPGLELTANVKKVMCMGNSWSHDIPGCRKIKRE